MQEKLLMIEWFNVAKQWSTIKRAIKYASVVGPILILINHGNAILQGDIAIDRAISMMLTIMVPFFVSTASTVGATLEFRKRFD